MRLACAFADEDRFATLPGLTRFAAPREHLKELIATGRFALTQLNQLITSGVNSREPSCPSGAAFCRTWRGVTQTLAILIVFPLLEPGGFILRGADLDNGPALEQLVKEREQLAERSKWPEATAAAEKVVAVEREKWGDQNCETAEAMYRLGYLANCACQPAKAEQIWLDALSIQEKVCGKDSLSTARTLRSLGCLYEAKASDSRWEQFLERSRKILEVRLGPDSVEVATIICNLGYGHYDRGELAIAQAEAVCASEICERAGRNGERVGEGALNLLGLVSGSLHDYSQAEASFSRVLASRTRRLGTDDLETAEAMQDLARTYGYQRRFKEAEALFKRSLAIQERERDAYERQLLFDILQGFGDMYMAWGQPDKAEDLLRRAREVLDESQWSQKRKVATSLSSLAEVYEQRGDYQKAHDLVETSAKLRGGDFREFNGYPAELLLRLARIEYETGRPAEALARAPAVEQAEDRRLNEVLKFTSETERLHWQREEEQSGSLNLWATLGAAEPLARCILRNKATVLDSLIEERLVTEASRDNSIRELIQQLKQARSSAARLATLELGKTPLAGADLEASAQSVSAKVDALEASLARKVTGLGSARRALSVQPAEVQSALPQHVVLVELVRYRQLLEKGSTEQHYGALLFSCAGPLRWIPLGSAAAIDTSVALYKHLVRESGNADGLISILKNLDRYLWKPISLELPPGTEQIILSPDSELNFVSFSTLLEPDGFLLGEKYRVSYVSSGRDLLIKKIETTNQGYLTILANPDFGTPIAAAASERGLTDSTARLFRGLNFQPLPGAENEGLWLRKRAESLGFNHVELYLGPEATKGELMRVHSPEVLHLATHGFILPEQAVTAPDGGGLSQSATLEANTTLSPMLRSGLALAGAESTLKALAHGKPVRPEDDGIVTAEEICCLDLRGTRLVVLSGCDTGMGEACTGEGVLGLRRGFALAGAQNLLMTLWPVQDDTTSRMMLDFYTNLSRMGNPAEALAKTQGNWLKKLREEKGAAEACRIAGPFVLSFRGPI